MVSEEEKQAIERVGAALRAGHFAEGSYVGSLRAADVRAVFSLATRCSEAERKVELLGKIEDAGDREIRRLRDEVNALEEQANTAIRERDEARQQRDDALTAQALTLAERDRAERERDEAREEMARCFEAWQREYKEAERIAAERHETAIRERDEARRALAEREDDVRDLFSERTQLKRDLSTARSALATHETTLRDAVVRLEATRWNPKGDLSDWARTPDGRNNALVCEVLEMLRGLTPPTESGTGRCPRCRSDSLTVRRTVSHEDGAFDMPCPHQWHRGPDTPGEHEERACLGCGEHTPFPNGLCGHCHNIGLDSPVTPAKLEAAAHKAFTTHRADWSVHAVKLLLHAARVRLTEGREP